LQLQPYALTPMLVKKVQATRDTDYLLCCMMEEGYLVEYNVV